MATSVAADLFHLAPAGALTPATSISTSPSSVSSSFSSSSAFIAIFSADTPDEPSPAFHHLHRPLPFVDLSEFDWEEIPPSTDSPAAAAGGAAFADEFAFFADHGRFSVADPDVEWEEIVAPVGSVSLAHGGDGNTFDIEEVETNEAYNGDNSELVEIEAAEGFVYTSDQEESYEVLDVTNDEFGKIRPPAAKSAMQNLASVVLAEPGDCAVCKEGVNAEEWVRKLPCSHWFHDECILPWLGLRNSCPLCRFELPTDDADYETWKARRAARSSHA